MFLKPTHKIKQKIFDILRIKTNSVVPYNFPRKSCTPPQTTSGTTQGSVPNTLDTTAEVYIGNV